MLGVSSEPNVNPGNTRANASLASRGAFISNVNDTDEAADTTGYANRSILWVSAGASTAVDVVIAAAAISATAASVAAAVRVASSAPCTADAVVTPVPTDTEHCVYASSAAVAAVSVSVAVLVPDKVAPTVKLVAPHPLRTRFAGVAKLKVGSSRLMASDVASWTFRANVKVSADGAVVTGFATSRIKS